MNIAYNIIQKHRGTIDVESSLGEGTRFIIRLPAGEPTDETTDENAAKESQGVN